MDSRLMVFLELIKENQKFTFSVQQHAPFKLTLEALEEFKAQILEWQNIMEQRQAALENESPNQQSSDSPKK